MVTCKLYTTYKAHWYIKISFPDRNVYIASVPFESRVIMMYDGNQGRYRVFKSRGERSIADFLEDARIDYVYEPGVLVVDQNYQRIWYPDFGLSQYDVFIEYLGVEQDPEYDSRSRHKLSTYKKNNIDIIPLYPHHLKTDYGSYILDELYRCVSGRMSMLERTINTYHSRCPVASRMAPRGYSRSFSKY